MKTLKTILWWNCMMAWWFFVLIFVFAGTGCGSNDESSDSSESAVATSEEKDNAATWDESSKNNIYISCMGTRTDAVMNAYCACSTQSVVRMFKMQDVELNAVACLEKWKVSGEAQKCVNFANGN